MKCSKNICKIPITINGKNIFKYPKLIELYKFYFQDEPNNLHNSFIDILICLRCFYKMIYNDDLCKKNKNFNSLVTNMSGV